MKNLFPLTDGAEFTVNKADAISGILKQALPGEPSRQNITLKKGVVIRFVGMDEYRVLNFKIDALQFRLPATKRHAEKIESGDLLVPSSDFQNYFNAEGLKARA